MKERKRTTLPNKYEKNFLSKLDGRYELARELKAAYSELTDDLGGSENLSHIKRALCERFVWLEAVMRGIEKQIAEGSEKKAARLLSRWIQAVNSLTGLAKSLGLERRARKVEQLREYVDRKSNRVRKQA